MKCKWDTQEDEREEIHRLHLKKAIRGNKARGERFGNDRILKDSHRSALEN
jgi:hypothetical protein